MSRGARTIHVDNEGLDIEITLWVNYDGETQISIQQEDMQDYFDVPVALEIATAIKRLDRWSRTDRGKEKIAEMQKKELDDYNKHVLKRRTTKT